MAGSSKEILRDWIDRVGAEALDVAAGEAADIIALVDRELTIQYINYATQGFTRDGVLGTSLLDITPPDYHDAARAAFSHVFETGEKTHYEVAFKQQSNLHVWDVRLGPVRIAGQVVGVIAANTDVSEPRRESVERNRFFHLSLDTLTVATPEGRYARVNPAFGRALGYDASELEGKLISDLLHPDDVEKSERAFERVLSGQRVMDFENRQRCKDGTYRVFSWRAILDPLTGDAYAVARDVTEQRQTEVQLRHAQKMEAIGQLAGGVAHDFNNLMLAVLANAELALPEAQDRPGLAEHLEEIQTAGERAAALTAQLLAFSRRQPLRAVAVDVHELLHGLVKMLRRLLPESIVIELVEEEALTPVTADPTQIEQVVINLCLNARDAMPQGGKLTIVTENVVLDGRATDAHPQATPGSYVLIRVSDTGVGMTPEVVERAFEPFFTTKPVDQGTGLGLATVYGIVQQHSGVVQVATKLNEGTTFRIYLPSAAGPVRSAPARELSTPVYGQETILLAEDEQQVRKPVAQTLERAGYRVLLASNGREAIERLREVQGAVDLAILDVVMPELGGPEAWERISEQYPQLRVLFASGYSDGPHNKRLPPNSVIVEKPFRMNELLQRVRETLDAPAHDTEAQS